MSRSPLTRPTSRSAIEVLVCPRCAGPRRIVVGAVTELGNRASGTKSWSSIGGGYVYEPVYDPGRGA
jgi:hypothetical protein